MASVSTNAATGLRRILFTWNGSRRTLYLGRLPAKSAQSLATLVEALIAAKTQGVPLDADTAARVRGLGDDLHARLSAVGLVSPRPKSLDLVTYVAEYIASRHDWKPNSLKNANQAKRYLTRFFVKPVNLDAVTEADAKAFRRWLSSQVGENTTRRNCRWLSQFFRSAVDRRLIDRNPFAVLKGLTMRTVEDRYHFVDRATATQVLEACPSVEWRTIFALTRFGGLRCPSEVLNLRWTDIDWDAGRMTIDSPKTGLRQVPLFPELRPVLSEAWDLADDGAVFVVARRQGANLRTQFERVLRRAGVTPWPKLFQNLRSSRETELAEVFPLHVVCKWIGNSQPVAFRHYLQVTGEHWDRATQPASKGEVIHDEAEVRTDK